MIVSRTPHRISLAGGGTDFPAWYMENGGSVIGFTIKQYCYISIRHLPRYAQGYKHRIVWSKIELVNENWEIKHPAIAAVLADQCVEDGLEIHHAGDVPSRAGLGSSSAFTVGLLNALAALRGRMSSKDELAREAIRIEQDVIREAVGSQDQILAAYGGFNRIHFDGLGFHIRPIPITTARLNEIMSNLLLVFTSIQRTAAVIEARKIATIKDHSSHMSALMGLVEETQSIIVNQSRDPLELANVLHESWEIKRALTEGVSDINLDNLYECAMRNGALGGKLLGAGGGGCFLFVVPPEKREKLKKALQLIEIPIQPDLDGSRIVVYEPNGWR